MKDQEVDWSKPLDAAKNEICIIDLNILQSNKPLAKTVGLSKDEIIGKSAMKSLTERYI